MRNAPANRFSGQTFPNFAKAAHKRATRLLDVRSRVGTDHQTRGANVDVWVGVLVAVVEIVVIVGIGFWLAQRRRRRRTPSERGRGVGSARDSRNVSPTDRLDEPRALH